MAIVPARFSVLTFPQSWDGTALTVRFVCLPKGDPEQALGAGQPPFATANIVYEAKLVGGLDTLPMTGAAAPVGPLVVQAPTAKAALFAELRNQFNIIPPPPPPVFSRPEPVFRKVITPDYRALIGDAPRSQYLSERAEFECALHQGASDQAPTPEVLSDAVTWGKVIAYALRQPRLATALGLMGQTTVTPADPAIFEKGGWLFLDLHATSDYAGVVGFVARYAARIPPLSAAVPRPIFAPVLFPVDDPAAAVADDVFREAEIYDRGFAREVHGAQSSEGGDAIQIAWDDAQLAEWLNRQVQRTPSGELRSDTPTGVAGYRVDVRVAGDSAWTSLVRVRSTAPLALGPHTLGAFDGENLVEVVPAQLSPQQAGQFWFPSYFATWRGSSLALSDEDLVKAHARPELQDPSVPAYHLNREKVFEPVDAKAVALRYGKTYDFRVRLVDLSRGGPDWKEPLENAPETSVLTVPFKRRKRPGPIEILKRPTPERRRITIAKPRLGYPELLFTPTGTFADIDADLDAIAADAQTPNPTLTREAGAPDPDVVRVAIRVDVKTLDGDVARYLHLYDTWREFEAAELRIALRFRDRPMLAGFPSQPNSGPLVLPTARDIRLTFAAVGRNDPGYFEDDAARHGVPVVVDVHADATAEAALLIPPDDVTPVRGFFFQPPPDSGVASPAERLGAELDLDSRGLTLSGRGRRRTVLACSAGLRHTLSPERSSITFASAADLVQRWVCTIQFSLARDWTWNGLMEEGIDVRRVIHRPGQPDQDERIGTIRLPHAIAPAAVDGVDADARAASRQATDLVFFDAIDPKPPDGTFPTELTVDYELSPSYRGVPAPSPIQQAIRLPVTTPPAQVPQILSAGVALSPYSRGTDYSFTEGRDRTLWFEFAEEPRDTGDAYFVRILATSPDPLLMDRFATVPEPVEPALAIDPEWMREIAQGQPSDRTGWFAMQPLPASASAPRHYLVKLPDDIAGASPELFGFFVYEVRVGHADDRWCTAQGRFGPALRVAGVQHPAPQLDCQAARGKAEILVRAPFATPVLDGHSARPRLPATHLWSLMYARVRQMDAADWRNVLIARTRLLPPSMQHDRAGVDARVLYGEGLFDVATVTGRLRRLGLPADAPLTVLAAEVFADPAEEDPLGDRLGHGRILRISPLVPVPDMC